MTEKLVLVTGACGEIGQAFIQGLSQKGGYRIVTSDLAPLPDGSGKPEDLYAAAGIDAEGIMEAVLAARR